MRAWLQTWWLRIPMPRELSVAFTLLYVIAFASGIATLLVPPISLSREVGGPEVMASVGVLLSVGALTSMWGGYREHWKVERIGLWLMAWALLIYAAIVAALHFSSTGSRLTQLGVIAMALTAFLIRFLMIWRFTFRPRGCARGALDPDHRRGGWRRRSREADRGRRRPLEGQDGEAPRRGRPDREAAPGCPPP